MKSSKAQTRRKFHGLPTLKFEEERRLTSFGGLVVFMALFRNLQLARRLGECFMHLGGQKIFGFAKVTLLLVIHCLLGYRRLRDLDAYRDDPLVARALGVGRLPDVSVVSRTLKDMDDAAVENVRGLVRELVLKRLATETFASVTLDFDGSVQSTKGHAEGTAVGFNKVKKGSRSYYPLYCTVAQSGQFLDLLHRPGNVHDSKGAGEFMLACFTAVREHLPSVRLETRIDSAFFSEAILDALSGASVGFTCSVPFNRYPVWKQAIEQLEVDDGWDRIDDDVSYAEMDWKPKSWAEGKAFRFIAVRKRKLKQTKGPLQLDLFEPRDHEHEYKVVVTNRPQQAAAVLAFHNGRGSQEQLFAEGKQFAGLGVVATKRKLGNQMVTIAGLLAHNLGRELQMCASAPTRLTMPKRPARWAFMQLGTLQRGLIRCAGVLSRPQGRLSLTLGANEKVRGQILSLTKAARDPSVRYAV